MCSSFTRAFQLTLTTAVLLSTLSACSRSSGGTAPTAPAQPTAVPAGTTISSVPAPTTGPLAAPTSGRTPIASSLPPTPQLPTTLASAIAPTPDHNRVAATIQLGNPSSMTVADGFIWVMSGSSVVQIDPKTNQVVGKPIPAGNQLDSAVAFGEGALWVTTVASGDLGAPSEIDAVSRINPQTGEIVAAIKVSRAPMSLAVTNGAVWVVNFGLNGDTVTRIDTKTNQIVGEPIVTGRAPLSMAVGDGSVWVANHDAGTVTRIDPITNQVVANISVPSEPHRVAYGEGALWVGNWHDNSVSRIDPKTNQVVGEPIPIGFPAGNIAVGYGSVWVTSDYRGPLDGDPEDVVVVRIDPQTSQAIETIPVGGHPIDVEFAEDAVWVSVQGPDMVVRIEP